MKYTYYDGDFNISSNLKNEKPSKIGIIIKSYGLKGFENSTGFTCEYNGYYEAKITGYHYFIGDGGKGLQFTLADKVLLNYDKKRDDKLKSSAVIYLEKGFHAINIKTNQKGTKKKINLKIYIPNVSKGGPEHVSFNSFFYKK